MPREPRAAVSCASRCIPTLIGQAHRAKYLDELLGYIMSHDGVWQTTADEIAEHYIANHYDEAVAHATQYRTQ